MALTPDQRQEIVRKDMLRVQAVTWLKRAEMAYQQKNTFLSNRPLAQMWLYEKSYATLNGDPEPSYPADAEEFFKDKFGPDPDSSPSLVPRRPYPSSGAGEISLPLPSVEDE